MTITHPQRLEELNKKANEALIDQLRACKTNDEILKFESWFNTHTKSGPLYEVICELLRNRSISRVLAAKWLLAFLKDRDSRTN